MKQVLVATLLTFAFAAVASAQFVPCYDPPEDPCIGKCFLEQYFSDGSHTTLVGEHFDNPCPFHEGDGYQWGQYTQYQEDYSWVCCDLCAKYQIPRKPTYSALPILRASLVFPSPRSIIAATSVNAKRCGGS